MNPIVSPERNMLQPVGNICPLPIVEFGNGGMETMLTAASYDRQIPVHRRMTYEQMLQAVEPCSVHVTEGVLPGDVSGVYDESVSTIVIDGSMTDVQKRCALVHELLHWLHADDSCAGVGKTHEEVRVCRETAMMLVAPDAYIRAEREYDGEIYQMACELDVTVFVLKCYRRILEGRARAC